MSKSGPDPLAERNGPAGGGGPTVDPEPPRRAGASAIPQGRQEPHGAGWAEALLEAEGPVLQMIGSGRPPGEVLEAVCLLTEALCPGALASVMLPQADGLALDWAFAPGLPAGVREASGPVPVGPSAASCGTAFYRGEAVVSEDLAADPAWAAFAAPALSFGLRACYSTPFRSATGGVLGTIDVYFREPRGPSFREARVVRRAAELAAIALERHGVEEARRGSAEHYRAVYDQAGVGIAEADLSGRFTRVNDRYCEIVGYLREELLGLRFQEITHPGDPGLNFEHFEGLADGRPAYTIEKRYVRKDGRVVWARAAVSPLRGVAGRPSGVVAVVEDVTERVATEAALRLSEGRFRRLAEAMPQIVWTASHEGAVDYFNSRWYEYTGLTPDASLVDGWREAVHPDDRPQFWSERARGLAVGDVFEVELRLRRGDGEYRWHLVRSAPIQDERGAVVRRTGTATDIEALKRAEVALRAGEERFARFMQQLPGLAWIKDGAGRYLYANEAAEREFQKDRASLYGKTDEEVFPPEVAAQFRENDRHAFQEGAGVQVVETLRHADGALHHSLVSKFPIDSPEGPAPWVGGIAIDITDRLLAEEALSQSEARFRHLADAMPQIVWMTGPDHKLEYMNRRWLDFTGQTLEQVLQPEGWKAVVHPDEVAPLEAAAAHSHQSGTAFEAEYRLRARAGAYRWFLARSVPVLDESGRVVRRFGTATDIDDRRRAEETSVFLADASAALAELVDYEETLRRVAALAVPAFADWCAVDMAGGDGRLRRLAVTHHDPARLEAARAIFERYPPRIDDPAGVGKVIRTGEPELGETITDEMLQAGAHDADHLRMLRELGLRSYLCVPLRPRGSLTGALTFVTSESGRTYRAEELRVAEDLARRATVAIENAELYRALRLADRRKGEFLATLAHELRNPLAPVRSAARLLAGSPAVVAEAGGEVEMIERQVTHLTRLVDDLMDVARIERGMVELRRERVDLVAVARHALQGVGSLAQRRSQKLSGSLPAGPIPLEADVTRLEQVLDNLLTNAIKYTEPGGRIVLSAALEGAEAVVRVKDTGIGVPAEMLPRVFEMFAQVDGRSTRSQGGLGIGLGLVKSLVELHGGSVSAFSAGVGAGSEFVVRLPALSGTSEASTGGTRPAAPVATVAAEGGVSRRVLIVDDNQDAANSLGKLLTRLYGQEVRVAFDGDQALVEAARFRPEVVVLDLGMPGLDGYEVARRLRAGADANDATLVALSGWGQESDRRQSAAAGFDVHLVKPADPDALWAAISGHS